MSITTARTLRHVPLVLVALLSLVAAAVAQAASSPAARAADSVVYDAIPATLPSNAVSLGFSATRTSEFGDRVQLAGTAGALDRVEVGFSSWACESGAWNTGDCVTTPGATFTHPVTVTVYAVGAGGRRRRPARQHDRVDRRAVPPERRLDELRRQEVLGWCHLRQRRAVHPLLRPVRGRREPAGEVIVGVSFDTRNGGSAPLPVTGPYDALNVAVEGAATTGADADADVVYLDSSVAGNYTTPGATGVFRADAGWAAGGYGTLMLAIVLDAPSASEPPATTPVVPASGDAAVAASGAALPASAVESGTTGGQRTVALALGPAYENQWFFVVFYSDPTPVGWVWLGPGGTATITVPASLPAGTHTIALLDDSGNVVAHVAGVSIAAVLAATGFTEAELIVQFALGVVLLLLGAVGVTAATRARRTAV